MSDVLDKIRERWDFRSNYLIDLLSKADFAQLFEGSFEEKFKKGEVVVRKNHVPEYVYFIKEGSVKRYAKDSHDKEYIIQILRKNLFLVTTLFYLRKGLALIQRHWKSRLLYLFPKTPSCHF